MDEPGVVTLSARQPMAGVTLTATITDPDGATSNPEWQWQKGSSNIPNADVGETYTPADSDRGSYLPGDGYIQGPGERQGYQEGKMSGRTMLCCGPHPVTMPLSSLTRTLSWTEYQPDMLQGKVAGEHGCGRAKT